MSWNLQRHTLADGETSFTFTQTETSYGSYTYVVQLSGMQTDNNSTKSSITRPMDKGFYTKRKRDLKRKSVVCLVKKDSRVASLADRVDEDLVVVEASSVGGEENT